MSNPFRGEAPLQVGDEVIDIRITWDVMAKLIGRFGTDWAIELNAAFVDFDVDKIAEFLGIASGRDASLFRDASPPWIEVREAWTTAHNLFMFGVPMVDEDEPAEEKETSEDGPLTLRKLWSDLGTLLLRRVWSRANSGDRRSMNARPTSGQGARA